MIAVVDGRVTAGGLAVIGALLEGLAGGLTIVARGVIDYFPFRSAIGLTALIMVTIPVGYFLVVGSAATRTDDGAPIMESILPVVYTVLALIGVAMLWNHYQSFTDIAMLAAIAIPVLVFAYILYAYFANRMDTARRTTAVDRTRRDVRRDFEGWAQLVAGIGAIGIAVAFGIFSGLLSGMSGLGDALTPYAGEIVYLGVTALGYLSLGGDIRGWTSEFLQTLPPEVWVGIVLMAGGVAIFVGNR